MQVCALCVWVFDINSDNNTKHQEEISLDHVRFSLPVRGYGNDMTQTRRNP